MAVAVAVGIAMASSSAMDSSHNIAVAVGMAWLVARLRVCTFLAAHVADDIRKAESQCGQNEQQPVKAQPEERPDPQEEPHQRRRDETYPKDADVQRRALQPLLWHRCAVRVRRRLAAAEGGSGTRLQQPRSPARD